MKRRWHCCSTLCRRWNVEGWLFVSERHTPSWVSALMSLSFLDVCHWEGLSADGMVFGIPSHMWDGSHAGLDFGSLVLCYLGTVFHCPPVLVYFGRWTIGTVAYRYACHLSRWSPAQVATWNAFHLIRLPFRMRTWDAFHLGRVPCGSVVHLAGCQLACVPLWPCRRYSCPFVHSSGSSRRLG